MFQAQGGCLAPMHFENHEAHKHIKAGQSVSRRILQAYWVTIGAASSYDKNFRVIATVPWKQLGVTHILYVLPSGS